MCKIASGKLLYIRELSSVFCDDLEGCDGRGGREAQEGGVIYILIADSHCLQKKLTQHCKELSRN